MKPLAEKNNIQVYLDDDPPNPREDYDHLGKMICFHKRYKLGDPHDYDIDQVYSWDDLRNQILETEGPGVILPLYMYDHSGLTIRTYPFDCPWDSGQIGYIYGSEARASEFGISKEKIQEVLEEEVEMYDQYLQVYAYSFINTDDEGNVEDSLSGILMVGTPDDLIDMVISGQL